MHKTAPGGVDSSKRATPTSKPRTTTAAAQSANPPRAAGASAWKVPPFIVDELPPAKSGTLAPWRVMAEANPGRWVVVKVAPGHCADRATKGMTARGIKCALRKVDDGTDYGVAGPCVVTFARYEGVPA